MNLRTRHEAHDESEAHPPLAITPIAEWLGRLLATIQAMVLPPEIFEMPYLDDGADAAHAATEIGRLDAESNPADELTRNPQMPHQGTVLKYVMELQEIIGQRAHAVLAALNAGTLTAAFTPQTPLRGWKATGLRTKVLMVVAFVLEIIFGAKMAERLAGTEDAVSWIVGLAVAAVLSACALSVAQAIHTQQVGLLRGNGAWLGLGVTVLAIAFLVAYAWGLGGGAEATPSVGGLSGGTAAGEASSADDHSVNIMLVIIYTGLLLLLLTTVVLSHLLDLFNDEVAREHTDMVTKSRVLSPSAQVVLTTRLLRQCLVLNDQAKHRALGLLQAYVGGVRSVLPPSISSAWNSHTLENVDLPDPAWVRKVEAEIARLEDRPECAEGDDVLQPPLFIVHP